MLLPRSRFNKWSLLTVAVLVVAVGGYLLVHFSHAAGDVAVPASKTSVKIPTAGAYFGGSSNDTIKTGGCTGSSILLLDCKVQWAADQQGLSYDKQSDGNFHLPLTHEYVQCSTANSAFQPGGTVYDESKVPGRTMLLINAKCGTWASVIDGSQDANIARLTQQMINLNMQVVWTFDGEPEDNSCDQANGYTGTPDEYREAFRHWAAIVRNTEQSAGKYNIATGWLLQGETFNFNSNTVYTTCTGQTRGSKTSAVRNPENWYPGDDAVDWLVDDVYSGPNAKSPFSQMVKSFNSWASAACPSSGHPSVNWNCTSARQSKPLAIGEYGGCGGTVPQMTTWLDAAASAMSSEPKIKMLSYFHSNGCITDTASDHTALKAFASYAVTPSIANLKFTGGNPTPTPAPTNTATPKPTPTPTKIVTPTPTPQPGDTTKPMVTFKTPANGNVSGEVAIVANASDNVAVTKVEYYLDDKLQSSDGAAPYSFNLDTTTVSNGSHVLQLHALDSAGNVGLSGKVTLAVNNLVTTPTPTPKPGDLNADGKVDITDLSILESHWDMNYPLADLNHDGTVNITDLSVLLSHWTG